MANVQDVAKFFIGLANDQANNNQGDMMTHLRLQKLLYFAQGWNLARYGKPLFDDEIEAWQELFPDRFELDSDEESMVDAALEGNEHVNELQIWQELFPEKFDLNDVDQKKMDLAVEINNSHMDEKI